MKNINQEQAYKKLEELIPIYKQNKTEADSYKKICDNYNAEIKKLMVDNDLASFSVDGIKATCTKSYHEEFIEEAIIQKIKSLKVKGVIKTKEYVDMEALENAIYNGQLNAAELASCQTSKEVITLRIK